jgi:site-specific DNA-methyltransferase (adenine-specific)
LEVYYKDKYVKLIHGDCLEVMDKMIKKEVKVDAIICDLPYGITSNKWDSVIPLDRLWEKYLGIIKDNAIIALSASQPFTSALVMSNPKLYKHEWIWIKNRGSNFANTVREPMKEHESVLVFSKGKWTYNKQMQERTGGGLERIKYDFNCVSQSENYRKFEKPPEKQGNLRVPSSWQKYNVEVGLHPTQKPVGLMEYIIKTYTNEGETILDNTCGSSTTLIAAQNTNRKCYGIEKEEKYCEISKKRLEENLLHIKSQ